MLSKNVCFGTVALLTLMSTAYPQGAMPPAGQMPALPPPQVAAPNGNATSQTAVQLDEVTRSNPDPATQRFVREFERKNDSFVAPSINMDINGAGISLPKCASEAKDGVGCE